MKLHEIHLLERFDDRDYQEWKKEKDAKNKEYQAKLDADIASGKYDDVINSVTPEESKKMQDDARRDSADFLKQMRKEREDAQKTKDDAISGGGSRLQQWNKKWKEEDAAKAEAKRAESGIPSRKAGLLNKYENRPKGRSLSKPGMEVMRFAKNNLKLIPQILSSLLKVDARQFESVQEGFLDFLKKKKAPARKEPYIGDDEPKLSPKGGQLPSQIAQPADAALEPILHFINNIKGNERQYLAKMLNMMMKRAKREGALKQDRAEPTKKELPGRPEMPQNRNKTSPAWMQ